MLSYYFTGVANKDTANEECEIPFVAYYCLGQDTEFSDYNTEEHVDANVIEYIQVYLDDFGQYLSCCPPYSKEGGTNTGDYYRCNTWTSDDNNNCHTPGLPWNDEANPPIAQAGAYEAPGFPGQWMYSFPAEGEGEHWKQGLARRIFAPDIVDAWRDAAGGCPECGEELEDGCVGKCLKALSDEQLKSVWEDVAADMDTYPNYPVQDAGVIMIARNTSFCLDLSSGDSSWGVPIGLWMCNGLVNQQWEWIDEQIILAGSNNPGKCLSLVGGFVRNGATLQLWGCDGSDSQRWDLDGQLIRYAADPSFCLDAPTGAEDGDVTLQLWECNGYDTQNWVTGPAERAPPRASSRPTRSPVRSPARSGGGNATHSAPRSSPRTPWLAVLLERVHQPEKMVPPPPGASTAAKSSEAKPAWHERIAAWYDRQATGVMLPRGAASRSANATNTAGPASAASPRWQPTRFVHRPPRHRQREDARA